MSRPSRRYVAPPEKTVSIIGAMTSQISFQHARPACPMAAGCFLEPSMGR
ncbi:hypothetical protein [Sorangium sp. So ce1389]